MSSVRSVKVYLICATLRCYRYPTQRSLGLDLDPCSSLQMDCLLEVADGQMKKKRKRKRGMEVEEAHEVQSLSKVRDCRVYESF